jgi:hypothetical protein
MKLTLLTICAATVLFTACNNETKSDSATNKDTGNKTAGATTESESKPPAVKLTKEEMDKKWMESITPGEMHKVLAATAGKWDCDVTMWMGADSAGVKSKATSVSKVALNGLFVENEHSGDMMGMPFVGKGVTGYDNTKKKFVSSWYDNMSSGVLLMEGDYDPATKTLSFAGDCVNPVNGEHFTLKEKFKTVDENTQIMEMYSPDMATGKEYKNMEIVMKRKK